MFRIKALIALLMLSLTACTSPEPVFVDPAESAPAGEAWKDEFFSLAAEGWTDSGYFKEGTTVELISGMLVRVYDIKKDSYKVEISAPHGWVSEGMNVLMISSTSRTTKCADPFSADLLPETVKFFECPAFKFGKESTDYVGIEVDGFSAMMWTKTGEPY